LLFWLAPFLKFSTILSIIQGGERMNGKNLGQYLKSLRKVNGYTQEYVASYLDISRQAYSHYETNRVTPPNDICCKIANLYHLSTDAIISFSISEGNDAENTPVSSLHEMEGFFNYVSNEENTKKLHYLSTKEKELMYYFHCLPVKDKDEIIEIMKLKLKLSTH